MRLRTLPAALLPLSAAVLRAQSAPAGGTIAGTVYDSLGRAPLAGAEVQLVPVDGAGGGALIATTDAAGRYRIDAVPAGRYRAGFVHPRVDSLGIGLAPVALRLAGDSARVDFGFPSAASVQRQLCGASEISDTTALLVGVVRDAATGAPRLGATVRLQWAEFVIDGATVRSERPELVVRTRGDGWYGVCGVPTTGDGDVWLVAGSGADTSGAVPLRLRGPGVVRRDLYVGRDTTSASGVRLRGVVRTASGTPVAGARVRVLGGADVATTDAGGAFALAGQPAGTRLLDVRAVGYVPAQLSVDLLARDLPNTVPVTLASVKRYLDTVRVSARSTYDADRTGFARRRRTVPTGVFLDRAAIARRRAVRTTGLFSGIAGVRFAYDPSGQPQILLRGTETRTCRPEIYIDGMRSPGAFGGLAEAADQTVVAPSVVNDVDLFTSPNRLHGIEIYRDASSVPALFRQTASSCGAVVLWTRPRDPSPPRGSRADS